MELDKTASLRAGCGQGAVITCQNELKMVRFKDEESKNAAYNSCVQSKTQACVESQDKVVLDLKENNNTKMIIGGLLIVVIAYLLIKK